MCLYLILCLGSERCYCRHPSEPQKPPLPLPSSRPPAPGVEDEDTMMEVRKTEKNSRINKKRNMCTVQCKRSICSLFNFASIGRKETTHSSVHEGGMGEGKSSPRLLLASFGLEQRHIRSDVGKEKRLGELSFLAAAASHAIRGEEKVGILMGLDGCCCARGSGALLGW